MHRPLYRHFVKITLAVFLLASWAIPLALRGYAHPLASVEPDSRLPVIGYAQNRPQAQSPAPILLEAPSSLFPPYGEGMCDSGWHLYPSSPQYDAYLALNVTNPISTTLHAEWRPTILTAGYYRVQAFVPSHAAIDWLCPEKHISWDTANAKYRIFHEGGSTEKAINQAPLNDEWVTLGDFYFEAGSTGYVSLYAATDEVNQTRTVSFSAMRFTWSPPRIYDTYLPEVMSGFSRIVKVTNAYTTDAGGSSLDIFRLGDPIRLVATGVNQLDEPTQAQLTFTVTGPCGPGVILNAIRTLPADAWTETLAYAGPTCPGIYTFEAKVTFFARTSTRSFVFVVNPESGVIISNKPAFDACSIGTPAQMQTWWNQSPYWTTNLYIGGIALSTNCTDLTPVWVNSVAQQGWSFIPTWVGPQAPCSSFKKKMVNDAGQAYLQGRDEANAAVAASDALGLSHNSIIYYDLEGFSGGSLACRNVVKSFINGWVERLHEIGLRAGVYGGACSSYPADWLTIPHVPDNVWIASWVATRYDPNATVFGSTCLPDTLWANHQRIKQYTGGHSETWGGVSLGIDSDIADGEVVLLPMSQQVQPGPDQPEPAAHIDDFSFASAETGWILQDGQFYLTADGGRSWQDRTPAGALLREAYLAESGAGWLAGTGSIGEIRLWRTADLGNTWQPTDLALDFEPGAMQIRFSDLQFGWLAVQQVTSSAFSLGALWVTSDGGLTWTRRSLPAYGEVVFADPQNGWLAGGEAGNQLYATRDGGLTWTAQDLGYTEPILLQAPQLASDGSLYLAVTILSPVDPRLEIFIGSVSAPSWSLVQRFPLQGTSISGASVQLVRRGATGLWAVLPGQNSLLPVPSGTRSLETAITLPEDTRRVEFSTAASGWALVEGGECTGEKQFPGQIGPEGSQPFTCAYQTALFRTRDGGLTWEKISYALP